MSRVLYLLRHGLTVWNRAGRHQGQKDSPLTIQGIAQAEAMGRRLAAEVGPAASIAFFARPLGRCRQSAAIVADVFGFDPEAIDHDDRLKEITFGRWDGQTHDEIKAVDRAAWTARRADRWAYVPAGGESYAMVAGRVAPGRFLGASLRVRSRGRRPRRDARARRRLRRRHTSVVDVRRHKNDTSVDGC